MTDVKWIKIVTDIFDDEKIILLEQMPNGDGLVVIWFKLLCLAGKMNNHGVLMINGRIPYTEDMLAAIFRRPITTVRLALQAFEDFEMIERVSGTVTIPNWDKHQNLDALEKKREYQKNLMRERRAQQRALCESNSEANSEANVSSSEEEKELEKELDVNSKAPKPKKKKYGSEFGNVRLTEEEHTRLTDACGAETATAAIEFLDKYIEEKHYKSHSHYLAIKRWVLDAINEPKNKPKKGKIPIADNNSTIDIEDLKAKFDRI